ncbi:unnamed protein product [Closterium sp. NIES-54]
MICTRYTLGPTTPGLPESLAPLPRSPAPPCTPCVEGRQLAAPHSSFPPTTALLQTLHLDIWGPSPILGPRQERYFLIVVDDYSHYTTVFPLRRKANCPVPIVSGGARGVAAEGGGTGAAGPGGAGFGGAGGVRVETFTVEDMAVSTWRPSLKSPPGFPSVSQFPPRLGSGGAGARDTGTAMPTPCTVRFLTRVQRLDWLEQEERERFERARQQQQSQSERQERVEESQPQKERVEESRLQQQVQLQSQQERVEEESRQPQQVQLQPQQEGVEQESHPQ